MDGKPQDNLDNSNINVVIESGIPLEDEKEKGIVDSKEDDSKEEEKEDLDIDISEEDIQRLYEESIKNFKEGEIISGHIVKINNDSVLVDVGFKSEGLIDINEFPYHGRDLKVGNKIDVFLEQTEDKEGMVRLSKEKANKIKIWDDITEAYKKGEVLEGEITGKIKGGLTIDIGLKAFLPGSQIDLRPIRNLDRLIGQKLKLKIIKMNKKRGNIVVSRRVLLEEERKGTRENTLASLEVGMIVDGVVKNITEYGAFIDIGGIDGLLHITDMSWGRINHPSELFAVGDKIKVVILKFEKENERVSLGYKQITTDPWSNIETKYPVGTRVRGKVVSITDYGAFIELEQGIEGLSHISEMSWSKHIKHPSKIVAIGDIIEAIVLSLDKEKKKISLGMKQVESNPWDNIEERYPIGSIVEGKIRNLTEFGAFVELEEGVDGLIHISDMSWLKKIKHPAEVVKKKDRVKVVVLDVNGESERLSLGLKQMTPDPWEEDIPKRYKVGSDVKGKIVKITNFGAFAELEDGVEGLIHISQLGSTKVNHPEDVIGVGNEITARIIKLDTKERKIGLSIKAYQEELEASEVEREVEEETD
ncbi:MAG: 30S ribosomal protein S1, partial [Nitrospinae bacterium]|nr:30S ribosomal protein S1 [Nitrospinota bacterium]